MLRKTIDCFYFLPSIIDNFKCLERKTHDKLKDLDSSIKFSFKIYAMKSIFLIENITTCNDILISIKDKRSNNDALRYASMIKHFIYAQICEGTVL